MAEILEEIGKLSNQKLCKDYTILKHLLSFSIDKFKVKLVFVCYRLQNLSTFDRLYSMFFWPLEKK